MNPVFADTFYWIDITNPKDSAHRSALLGVRPTLGSRMIVTTDEVLTEFLAFCASDPRLRLEAAFAVQDILEAEDVRVVPQSHRTFLMGLELYRDRPDKGYSLTDCISMQCMRSEGLIDVPTDDRHFEQEGFRPMFQR